MKARLIYFATLAAVWGGGVVHTLGMSDGGIV